MKEDLKTFVEELKGKSLDELAAIEKEIVIEADEHDKKLGEMMIKLPAEGWQEAAAGIRMLLNKQSIKWQYTLGFKNIYDFFDPAVRQTEIAYPMFDTTMRTLGALEFKGYDEWCAVININSYVEPVRPVYVEATEGIYAIAEKHSKVLEAMDALQKEAAPKAEKQ